MDPETGVFQGAGGEDLMTLACVVLIGVTDGRMNAFTTAKTGHLHSMLLC